MSRTPIRLLLALMALAAFAATPAVASAQRHGKKHSATSKRKKSSRSRARAADRNRDGLPDRWERSNHLSLRVNQAGRDQDRDGSVNAAEYAAGTDPRNADTDDDGVEDGAESAGTIVSFADDVLTIEMAGGEQVSATVTARTEISCGDGEDGPDGTDGADSPDGPEAIAASDGADGPEPADDPSEDALPGDGFDPGADAPGCDASALVAGAAIHEAELRVTADGKVWRKIELEPAAPAAPPA